MSWWIEISTAKDPPMEKPKEKSKNLQNPPVGENKTKLIAANELH